MVNTYDMSPTSLASDHLELQIECFWSNLGEMWLAVATDKDGKEIAVGKADSRPEALRALADELEDL